MRKVLIDVNVILDVFLIREPFVSASASVWAAIEGRRAKGLLAAHAVTTIYYLIRKEAGNSSQARRMMRSLLSVFGAAAVNHAFIQRALELPTSDFEDAVAAAAAEAAGCDLIVTRDLKGFRGSPVQAVTPEAAIHVLESA